MTQMKTQMKRALTLLLALTFAFTGAALADQWIHVKVDSNDEAVTVNLPLSLMRAATAMIPQEANDEMRVAIDDLDMD